MKIPLWIFLGLISLQVAQGLGTYGDIFKAAMNSKSIDLKGLIHDVNEKAENTIGEVKKYIAVNFKEPINLPNTTYKKKKKVFGINVGPPKVTFSKGWLKGLSGLHKSGDISIAVVKDSKNGVNMTTFQVVTPIDVDQMTFGYNYNASVLKGSINGTLRNLSMKAYVQIAYHTKQITTSVFSEKLRDLSMNFTGKASWLASFIGTIAHEFVKQNILKKVEITASALATDLLRKYDKVIKKELGF